MARHRTYSLEFKRQGVTPLRGSTLHADLHPRPWSGPLAEKGDREIGERGVGRVLVDDRQPVARREGLGGATREIDQLADPLELARDDATRLAVDPIAGIEQQPRLLLRKRRQLESRNLRSSSAKGIRRATRSAMYRRRMPARLIVIQETL